MFVEEEEVEMLGLKKIKYSTLKPYFDFQSIYFTKVRGDDCWDKIEYYIKE